MNAANIQTTPSPLPELVGELERGASRLAQIARGRGPQWTEDHVPVALVEPFSGGAVGHNYEVRFWWTA